MLRVTAFKLLVCCLKFKECVHLKLLALHVCVQFEINDKVKIHVIHGRGQTFALNCSEIEAKLKAVWATGLHIQVR